MSTFTRQFLGMLVVLSSCMLQLASAERETADFSLGVILPVVGFIICIVAVVVVLQSGRGESQQAGNPPSNPPSNPPASNNANTSNTTTSSASDPDKGSTSDAVAQSNAKSKESYKTARDYKEEMKKRQTKD